MLRRTSSPTTHRLLIRRKPAEYAVLEQVVVDPHFNLIAARDIAKGEELLMDYEDEPEDPQYYEDACQRYEIDWSWCA